MMGFDDARGQDEVVHQVKSEHYDDYDAYTSAMLNGDYRNDYNPVLANYGDSGVQFNQQAAQLPGDVSSQIYMDAERMAQLEREFHEQVC